MVEVKISDLVPSPYSANRMTAEEFQRLVENIKAYGKSAIEPIVVVPAPKEFWGKELENPATGDRCFCDRGSYVVVSGWHRVMAAKAAGLETVEAQVRDMSAQDIRLWTYRYNLKGRNVGLIVFEQIKQMLEDLDAKKVAEAMDVGAEVVRKVSRCGKIHDSVKRRIMELADPCAITLTHCIYISLLETEEYQNIMLDRILSGEDPAKSLERLSGEEELSKNIRDVDTTTKKVVNEQYRKGLLAGNSLVQIVQNYPEWMREPLMEKLGGLKDYLISAKLKDAEKEVIKEKEDALNSLPEDLREIVKGKEDLLNAKHIIAIRSVRDPRSASTLLNEIIQKKMTGSEAQRAARDMISQVIVSEPKVFPLTADRETFEHVLQCPHCKREVGLRITFNRRPSLHAEVVVLEDVKTYVVERRSDREKKEEVYVVNGLKFRVDYENRTVEQII